MNILDSTGMEADGAEIGTTRISWIPQLIETIVSKQESIIPLLPDKLHQYFIDDVLLTYPQFTKKRNNERTTNSVFDKKLQVYLRGFQDDYIGYEAYLQKSNYPDKEFFFRWFKARLPLSKVHTYIVGGSGSAKSTVMKSAIDARDQKGKSAIIILDPKGDLASQVMRWKRHIDNPDKLVIFDPFLIEGYTPILNPFHIKDRSERSLQNATFELRETFNSIMSDIDGEFSVRMKAVMGHMIGVVIRKGDGSLWDLKRFMNDATNKELLEMGRNSQDELTRNFFRNEYLELQPEILSGIEGRLDLLLQNETFRDLTTGESTIDLGKLIKDKKFVIFNLSKGAMTREYSKFFGKLVISMVLIEAMSNANKIHNEKERPQIDLFIDEYQNFATPATGEISAEARSYGIRMFAATQVVGQGMDRYLESLLLANTDTKLIGWSSIENRMAMSKQFGMTPGELEVPKLEFWVRIENKTPFKIKTLEEFAGNYKDMRPDLFDNMVKMYQSQYYVKLEKIEYTDNSYDPPKKKKPKFRF